MWGLINNHLVLFLFVRISPSKIRAKTELAIYCPMKIIKITQIAITPKTIFLIIGLAGFFNQFISKFTNNYLTMSVVHIYTQLLQPFVRI